MTVNSNFVLQDLTYQISHVKINPLGTKLILKSLPTVMAGLARLPFVRLPFVLTDHILVNI